MSQRFNFCIASVTFNVSQFVQPTFLENFTIKCYTLETMRKSLVLAVLGLYFCAFFTGCHTLDVLSRVKTGHVDFRDAWEAIIADDQDFQETYW